MTTEVLDTSLSDDPWVNALSYEWPSGPYIPHEPTVTQDAFLWLSHQESFYGGAAGGGKSDALLMAALQYVDYPDYSAILLRKTFTELNLDGAIMDRSHKWLAHTDASWNGSDNRWTFPSGARLQFGYLKNIKDRVRYQSAEYQYIGCDELTAFDEGDYRFMFSRLRRAAGSPIPIRMRSASNPGGIGGKWVKARFIEPYRQMLIARQKGEIGASIKRPFVPARLSDNPHVDQEAYINALMELEPELIAQLLDGDWDAREPGDWMLRDPRYIDAVEDLGQQLWDDHVSRRRRLPDPMTIIDNRGTEVSGLVNGIDWGEHTQGYVIWCLPDGGIFVPPSEVVSIGVDPAVSTQKLMEQASRFDHPLVQSNYDAAGIQSMRTYVSVMRKFKRYQRLRSMKIPFANYKKESIGYLRTLARRTHNGADTRYLAIHPANQELLRQLRIWRRKDDESDEAIKTDDHGPDALIAGIAPTARKFREYIEQEIRDAYGDDEVFDNDPDAPEYEATDYELLTEATY